MSKEQFIKNFEENKPEFMKASKELLDLILRDASDEEVMGKVREMRAAKAKML